MCIGAAALDGIGRHIAGHTEMTGIGFVAHGLQLADGDVVAFVGLHRCDCKIRDGAQDDYDCGADAECVPRDLHRLP